VGTALGRSRVYQGGDFSHRSLGGPISRGRIENGRFIVFLAIAALVGRGGSGAVKSAVAPEKVVQPQPRLVSPDTCDTAVHVTIKKVGGSFRVPPCSRWSGTINYPPTSNQRPYFLSVTSSVTNNFGAPPPPSGTAIFYLQTKNVTAGRSPVFDGGAMDTIASPQLTSAHSYTLIVYNFCCGQSVQHPALSAVDCEHRLSCAGNARHHLCLAAKWRYVWFPWPACRLAVRAELSALGHRSHSPKRGLDSKFIERLNEAAGVVAEDLAPKSSRPGRAGRMLTASAV
jgi:hypothetical protein